MGPDADDLVATARDLSLRYHEGQTRKGTDTPYHEGHLQPVADLVAGAGGTDVQVAAAYLHDAAEDCGGQPVLDEIRTQLGDAVADIVNDLSDSLTDTTSGVAKEDWVTRKRDYVTALETKPTTTLEVSVADKLHNATCILDDYDEIGEELWPRFNKKQAEYHLWYYGELARTFTERLPDNDLTARLNRTLDALQARIRAAIPGVDELVEGVRRSLTVTGSDGDPHATATWDRPKLRVAGDDARTAAYRRLQSWWRHAQLAARPGPSGERDEVGSALHPDDVADQPDLNFLHPAAHRHAEERIAAAAAEGATLEADRLRRNLLSSMPMCFNLFGTLTGHPQALGALQALIDPAARQVDEVTCEWSPKPREDHLGDRTAFDAVIRYRDGTGNPHLVGVETKYTEPFSPKAHDRPRYRDLTENCGWFAEPGAAADQLLGPATNQLWRQVLLCASLETTEGLSAQALVVCPSDDHRAREAVDAVRATLTQPDRLRLLTLEEIVAAFAGIGGPLGHFGARFANRYLHPHRPHHPELGGPRRGRPLTAP